MGKAYWMAGACFYALCLTAPVNAQSGNSISPGAPDIVVTATRREQRLQEVPLAVTALSSETLRTRGIENAADLGTGKVPGLAVNSLFGSEVSIALNMRGYGTSDASQGTQDQAVAFYLDGINLPRAQGMSLDLVTPERIEVLRGPQGQLFGRNAEAGAIQIVSKRPSGTLSGDLSGGYGNFNARFAKGRLDLPEIAGFRVQISGIYRQHDGYLDNVHNPLLENIKLYASPLSSFSFPTGNYDRNPSQLNSHGFRIAVERDFGRLNAFYTYDDSWARDDQGFSQFVTSPTAGTIFNPTGRNAPAFIQTAAGTFIQNPLDRNSYPGSVPFSFLYAPFINKGHGHMLNLTLQADDHLTLKSITGVRESLRYGGADIGLSVSTFQPGSTEYLLSKTVSQELQAIYDTSRFNITLGGIYFHETDKDERDSNLVTNCALPIPGTCDAASGQATRPWYITSNKFKRQFSRTNAFAMYAQAGYTPAILDDRIELIAGLRYSNDVKKAQRTILNGAALASPQTNKARAERVDPAFMVKFKVANDANIYARYARGFRDGGANVRSNIFSAYQPETLDSYEIGVKSQWFDRRVTLNIAAFRNIVNNQQQSLQSNPSVDPSLTDTFNVQSKYKTTGVEVELSVRPTPHLTLSGNYTYLHSNLRFVGIDKGTISSFALTNPTIGTATIQTPSGSVVVNNALIPSAADIAAHPNASFIQLYPLGSPKHSGSISADYWMPIGDYRLSAHLEWVRSGDMWVASPVRLVTNTSTTGGVTTVRPNPYYVAPVSSNRVNGRITLGDIALGGGVKGEIAFWGKNIFNHVDGSHAFGSGNAITANMPQPMSSIYLQPPRTFGGDLRVTF